MDDNILNLYNSLKNEGYNDIGTEDEFRKYTQEPQNRKTLYDALSGEGYDDIGTYEEFDAYVTPSKIEPHQQSNAPSESNMEVKESMFSSPKLKLPEIKNNPFPERTFDDVLNENWGKVIVRPHQEEPITDFVPAFQQGADGLYQGMKSAAGESGNLLFTGSQRDHTKAQLELDNLIKSGYNLGDFDAKKGLEDYKVRRYKEELSQYEQTMNERRKARENMGLLDSFKHKWDDPERPRNPNDRSAIAFTKQSLADDVRIARVYESISDALKKTNGDVKEAYKLLGEKSSEETWGDKTSKEARKALKEHKPTEGFTAFAGNMIPQMIGNAGAIVASVSPYTRWLSRPLANANMAMLTTSSAGSAMADARNYADEKGVDVSEGDVLRSGVLSAGIEAGTEMIPFDRYFGGIHNFTRRRLGKDVANVIVENPQAKKEFAQILNRGIVDLPSKLFTKDAGRKLLGDISIEGFSEFLAEGGGALVPMIYANKEDYPTLLEVLENGWEGAKGGFFMGGILGAGSKMAGNYVNRQRRKQQGYVVLADTENGVMELVGESGDKCVLMDGDGKVHELTRDKVQDFHTVGFNEFDAYTKFQTQENLQKAEESGKRIVAEKHEETKKQAKTNFANALRDLPDLGVNIAEISDVSEFITTLQENGRNEEDITKAENYFQAKAVYDGLVKGVIEEDNAEIDRDSNKETGEYVEASIINLATNERVSGNIVGGNLNDDKDRVVWKPKDGEANQMILKRDIDPKTVQSMPIPEMKKVNAEMVQGKMQAEAERMAKYSPEIPEPEPGVTFELNGSPFEIKQVDSEQLQVNTVDSEGNPTPITMSKQEYYDSLQAVIDEREARKNAPKVKLDDGRVGSLIGYEGKDAHYEVLDRDGNVVDQDTMSKEEFEKLPSYQEISDEELDSESPVTVQESDTMVENEVENELSPYREHINVSEIAPELSEANVEPGNINEIPAEQQSNTIPVDDKGNELYHHVPVDRTLEALAGVEPKHIDEFIEAHKKDSVKNLKGLQKSEPKMGTNLAKSLEAKRAWQESVSDAEARVNYWDEVANRIKELREKPGDSVAEEISSIGEPVNGNELAAMMLANGNLKLLQDSYQNETGFGTGESRNMIGLFASKDNGGLSIEEAGELLMLADLENGTNFFDQSDPNAGRNAILDVLGSARTRGDLFSYIQNGREVMANRERQAEYEAYERWVNENVGMSVEEFEAYESSIADRVAEKYKDITDEELNTIFADINERDYERDRTNDEGGISSIQPGSTELRYREGPIYEGTSEERTGEPGGNAEANDTSNSSTQPLSEEERRVSYQALADEYVSLLGTNDVISILSHDDFVSALINSDKEIKEAGVAVNLKDGRILVDFSKIDNEIHLEEVVAHEVFHTFVNEQLTVEEVEFAGSEIGELNLNIIFPSYESETLYYKTDELIAYTASALHKKGALNKYLFGEMNLDDIQSWMRKHLQKQAVSPILPLIDKILYNYEQRRKETQNSLSRDGLGISGQHLYDGRRDGETGTESERRSTGTNSSIPGREQSEVISLLDEAERIVKNQEIQSEEAKVNVEPSEAQKEAGNYKMGHVKIQGLDITIEQPKGSVRSGVDENGKQWSQTMNNTYGYIRGTESRDGDHIDIFLGDNPNSNKVFVVDQINPNTGAFDEHKVMVGFDSIDQAKDAYLSNYEEGWKGLGNITETDIDSFKKWSGSGGRRMKSFSNSSSIESIFRDGDKSERIEKLRNSEPVVITGEEIPVSDNLREYKKNALKYGKENLRGDYTNKDTGAKINVSKAGIKEVLQHDYKDVEQIQSIAAIPSIIENSIYIDSMENTDLKKNPQIKEYQYYVCGLKIDGVDYTVRSAVAIQDNGDRYYDHKLTKIEKGKLIDSLSGITNPGFNPSTSLSENKDKVLIRILQAVKELSSDLNTPIRVIEDINEIPEGENRKRGAKGWFDASTGQVVVVLPNAESVEDARATVFHEVVAHRGLRELFGKDFNTFLDNVYTNASDEIKERILGKSWSDKMDLREATEEYLAELAERGFNNEQERSLWQKIKDAFVDMLRKVGVNLGFELADNELRYILWKSYQNLKENNSILDQANDIALRKDLGVGNYRFRETEQNKPTEDKKASGNKKKRDIFTDRKIKNEDVIKEVVEYIRKEISSDDVKGFRKSDLNILINRLAKARTRKDAESIMLDAKRISLEAKIRATQLNLDKTLSLKVQDVNGKNMSIAKNVDESTRRIFELVRGPLLDIEKSGFDDDMKFLRRENADLRSDIEASRRRMAEDSSLSEQEKQNIANFESTIAENQKLIKELDAQKKEMTHLKGESQMDAVENIIKELNDKLDRVSRQEDIWKQEDTERLTAAKIAQKSLEIKNHNGEISNIQRAIGRMALANTDLYRARIAENNKSNPDKNLKEKIKYSIAENRRHIMANKRLINAAYMTQLENMQNTLSELNEIVNNGKDSLLKRTEKEIAHRNHLIRSALHDIEGEEIDIYDKTRENEKLAKKFFSAPLGSFEYMCKRIGTQYLGSDGFFYKYFIEGKEGTMEAENTFIAGMREFNEKIDDKSRGIFGKNIKDILLESDKEVENSGVHFIEVDPKSVYGERTEMPLTKGQAMYIYMVWKMNDGRTKLELQGIDEETMGEISDFLGEEYMNFADWVQDEFLPELREKYNDKYMEMYGTSLAKIENYIPLKILKTSIRKESDLSEDNQQKKSLEERAGSLINRTFNTNPVDITLNGFSVLFEHGGQMEEWNAFSRVRKELDYILSNTQFRNQLNANNRGSYQNFYEAAEVATHVYMPDKAKYMDDVLGKISKGIVGGNIAFRLMTAIKQVLSAPAFWGYSQHPEYLARLANNTFNPKALVKNYIWCMENLPSFQERVSSGNVGNEKLNEKGLSKWLDKYIEIGMIPNKSIDALTCSIGAKAIYDFSLKRLKEQGVEVEEAKRQARMEADIAYNQSQQSAHASFLSPMQRSRTFTDRMMTTYQNNNIGYVRKLLSSWFDMTKSLKWKQLHGNYTHLFMEQDGLSESEAEQKATNRLINENKKSLFNFILFGWGMNYLWDMGSSGLWELLAGGDDDDDDEVMKYAKDISYFLTSPMKGLPGGNLLSSLAEGYGMNPFMVYEELDKALKLTQKSIKDYGLISTPVASSVLTKISRYGGVDLEVWGNIYLGVEGLVREDAMSGDEAIDFLYLLNAPKSQRTNVAKWLYKDEPLLDYAAKVARAGKYVSPKNKWEYYVPGTKELTKKKQTEIKKELKEIKRLNN